MVGMRWNQIHITIIGIGHSFLSTNVNSIHWNKNWGGRSSIIWLHVETVFTAIPCILHKRECTVLLFYYLCGLFWNYDEKRQKAYTESSSELLYNNKCQWSWKWSKVRKGVRGKNVPSSFYLFTMFTEEGKEIIKRRFKSMKINETRIHWHRFADNTVLINDSAKEVNKMF